MQTRNNLSPIPKMDSSIDEDWVVTTGAPEEAEKNIQDVRRLEPAEAFTLTMLGAIFGVPLGATGAGMAFAVRQGLQKPAKAVEAVKPATRSLQALVPVLEPLCEAGLEQISKPVTVNGVCLQLFECRKTAETFLKAVNYTGFARVELVKSKAGEAAIQITREVKVASRSLAHKMRDDLARNWPWPLFTVVVLVGVLAGVGLSAWALKSSPKTDNDAATKENAVAKEDAVAKEVTVTKEDAPPKEDAAAEEADPAKAEETTVATTEGQLAKFVVTKIFVLGLFFVVLSCMGRFSISII